MTLPLLFFALVCSTFCDGGHSEDYDLQPSPSSLRRFEKDHHDSAQHMQHLGTGNNRLQASEIWDKVISLTGNPACEKIFQFGQLYSKNEFCDFFGKSFSLSGDGTVLAVVAPEHSIDRRTRGHVRFFKKDATGWWTEMCDPIVGAGWWGASVTLSYDGSRIIALGNGRVRVYEWNNDTGNYTRLGNFGEQVDMRDPIQVAISRDGSKIAARSGEEEDCHVRVYELDSDETWAQMGSEIVGRGGEGSISLSNNGTVVALEHFGGFWEQTQIFDWNGTNWTKRGVFPRLPPFGRWVNSLALSGDGSIIAVGSPAHFYDDEDPDCDSGLVQVYEWTNGEYVQLGQDLHGTKVHSGLGCTLSMAASGLMLAVGEYQTGIRAVFRYEGGEWRQSGQTVGTKRHSWRNTVALSDDGSTLVVGNDPYAEEDAVHVYELGISDTISLSTSTW
eukprot:scaffold1190_cov69-Cylindrotheca_fusiformis.AAC.2